jgi:hypothetical protein
MPGSEPGVNKGHSVVLLGQETGLISLGTPGSSPAPKATLERGTPRENQTKTENSMALGVNTGGGHRRKTALYGLDKCLRMG